MTGLEKFAGLHTGTVVFALEAGTCMGDAQTCTEKSCSWIQPPALKEVPYGEVRNIDFASAQKMKMDFDSSMTAPAALCNISEQQQSTSHKPTDEETLQFFSEVFIQIFVMHLCLYRSCQKI